jgi:signal peptidase I
MSRTSLPVSRWFLYSSTGLLVFLCLAVLVAQRILLRHSMEVRTGRIVGSSMEPGLRGPRIRIVCDHCRFDNRFTADALSTRLPLNCLGCNAPLSATEPLDVLPGQTIRYRPLPPIPSHPPNARTAAQSNPTHPNQPSAIQRWDRVVIRSGLPTGEVKRVVGLPGEAIEIRDGRICLNGQPIQRSPSQFLEQSVLVGNWSAQTPLPLNDWLQRLPSSIDNTLPINAHDSHRLATARDVGVSLRLIPTSEPWTATLVLRSQPPCSLRLANEKGGMRYTIERSSSLKSPIELPVDAPFVRTASHPLWIHCMALDDSWIVSDDIGTCLIYSPESIAHASDSAPVVTPPTIANQPTPTSPPERPIVSLELVDGHAPVDCLLLYRSIVYRGFGDQSQQAFPDALGYIVLGDNVSISEDSRGAGEASIRIPAEAIRGVLLPDSNPLENLLRQSENTMQKHVGKSL